MSAPVEVTPAGAVPVVDDPPAVHAAIAPEEEPKGRSGSRWRRRRATGVEDAGAAPEITGPQVDIAPNDPILAYFHHSAGVVDIRTLAIESPALEEMRAAGIVLVVPLVTSGELVGLLQLGPRLSERDYSKDDRQLLEALARYAAPALRVGQLVKQQEAEARTRERIEQELRVAQLIQQQFLPKRLPELPGWHVSAVYKPARTVGGDFYDFISLSDGRVMVVTGDVTDKGVPAALVMSSTHALLRETGPRLESPSDVLSRVNDLLCEDIPAHMFVTCLAMVLDPRSGRLEFANAGHNLPYVRGADGTIRELRATGMPLGLMPGMSYEAHEAVIEPGEQVLLYSDGLTEQHDLAGEMFGFGRTHDLLTRAGTGVELTDLCLSELARFTGPDVEQEDDITLVALERAAGAAHAAWPSTDLAAAAADDAGQVLAAFSLPSDPGNEREALARVAEAVAGQGLTSDQTDRLKTAVAEATMNAIEHGNHNQTDLPVDLVVLREPDRVVVTISDRGGNVEVGPTHPDLELKLAGLQTPRGWGLFLIQNMVDEVEQLTDDGRHSVRLVVRIGSEAPTEEDDDVDV